MSIVTFEKFKNIKNPRHGFSAQYWNIVETIWLKIQNTFYNSFESIQPCINNIQGGVKNSIFDIIYGDVQSGKSRAIMMLAWYSTFIEIDVIPVILTINLGSVRDDFIGKASIHGEINKIVKDTINESFSDMREYINLFQLKAIDFKHYRKQGAIKFGQLLILLQNSSNLKELIKLYQHINTTNPSKSFLVMIDEVHKMYTVPMYDRVEGLEGQQAIGYKNNKMMFWLKNKANGHKIYLLGITATPHRATTDIHLYPQQLVKLQSDPVHNMTYFGKIVDEKVNPINSGSILCHNAYGDIVKIIKNIIERKRNIVDGVKIIKSVLITVDRLQQSHDNLQKALKQEFSNKIKIFIVNAENNDLVEHFETLNKYINTESLQTKLSAGCLVFIGQGCFSAGVSVRPAPGQDINFNINKQKYKLFGLTDQIYRPLKTDGDIKSVENNIQAMRIFGNYPKGYQPHLWIYATDEKESQKGQTALIDQLEVNKQLVTEYQKNPHSITTYVSNCRFDLYEDSPYKRNQQKEYKIQSVSTKPDSGFELKTEIFPVGKWMMDNGTLDKWINDKNWYLIRNFYAKRNKIKNKSSATISDQKELKKSIIDTINNHFGETKITDTLLQIPYEKDEGKTDRYKRLLVAAVHPEGIWKVNYLLTGNQGPETHLSEIVLVKFTDPMQINDSRDIDQKYYYQIGDNRWVIVHPKKQDLEIYTHRLLDYIDGDLSDEHHSAIEDLDKTIVAALKQNKKPTNGWLMFIYWYRLTHSAKFSIKHYASEWKKADKSRFIDAVKQGLTPSQLNKVL